MKPFFSAMFLFCTEHVEDNVKRNIPAVSEKKMLWQIFLEQI